MKKIVLCVVVLLVVGVGVFFAAELRSPKTEAIQRETTGEVSSRLDAVRTSVHDPSILKADGKYYIFGSHIAVGRSDDLIAWGELIAGVSDQNTLLVPQGKTLREVLAEPLAWTDAYQKREKYDDEKWETNVWAPCVIYNEAMGKYCYYACSSVFGTPSSVIWFATADRAEGPYTYEKSLVYSGFDKRENLLGRPKLPTHYAFTNISDLIEAGVFTKEEVEAQNWFAENGGYNFTYGQYPNCIDPALFYDADGRLWMTYGSYSGGIYIMPLIAETGMPDYAYMRNTEGYDMYFGKQIAKTNEETNGSGEGPYITYDKANGYYYFYLTYGGLGALDRYQIRVYRSKSPDGDYTDAAGNSALKMQNTGLLLFGNYQFAENQNAYLSGGHSSSFVDDDGKMYQIYHTRFNDGEGGYFENRVHLMAVNTDGWPVMLPLTYNGETIAKEGYTAEEICGAYEWILHTPEVLKTDTVYSWENVGEIIRTPVDIVLAKDGTVTKNGKTCGNWSVTAGTPYIMLTVEGGVYRGVLCEQTRENDAQSKTLTFAACADNNTTVWGVKK